MGPRGSQGLALFRSTFPGQFRERWVRDHTSGHSTLPCGEQVSLARAESFSVQRAYPVGGFPQLPGPGPPQTWKLRSWDRKACAWGSHPGYADTPARWSWNLPRRCLPRRKTAACPLHSCMRAQAPPPSSVPPPPPPTTCVRFRANPPSFYIQVHTLSAQISNPLPAGLLPGLPSLSCAP